MNFQDKKNRRDDLYTRLLQNGVVVFGAGKYGKKYIEVIQKSHIRITQIWDNNPKLAGLEILGVTVEKPHYIENAVVIIAVYGDKKSIIHQLREIGIEAQRILLYEHIRFLDKNENRSQLLKQTYPDTIQFPITYKCNFNCIMCGMNKLQNKKEMDPGSIKKILGDDYYTHIHTVGINGGEPFLRNDFRECINAIIESLKEINRLNIISNGYYSKKILEGLSYIREKWPGVYVNLSISMDGVGGKQDIHRGKRGAFNNAQNTINEIRKDYEKYVNNLDLICTVTKRNVWHVYEVEEWAKRNGLFVNYNIASVNKRIENEDKSDAFLIQTDMMALYMAREFFYGQYLKTGQENYFAIYLYLLYGKRFALCPYKMNEWVTVLPDGDIEYCATRSKALGSGFQDSTKKILTDNQDYFLDLQSKYCDDCSHYMYLLDEEGLVFLNEEQIKNNYMRNMGEIYGM